MEGVQPLDENMGRAPRPRFGKTKLLLVVSVAQGLGLVLCLIYVCLHIHALQVPPKYPPVQSIKVEYTRCEKGEGFILTSQKKNQTMKVQNNSIIVKCDGFYLISLKGYFSEKLNISLNHRKDGEPLLSLKNVTSVNSILVAHLGFKDKVYLNVTTHGISCEDLRVNGGELILIHQSHDEFCVP
ncbi:tumor necrosis factor ligand superfamily member 4 [Tupaia chinensis]|uniref:Tumor necrosis factor ligand superfamily member 4 n=1 Tax=Tupaia chinensis TaxID=246437 RepID=L9L7E7_TUPCH|nr:tumor necrosis factor ligand superfamily member 4 [Tupaia chinensis]XP_006142407.1 tumor necrosis factor ligand superfamily member 4 [Tupaia chinensis]XP_027623778.1 tumor necrosis factor ligand superfamily member 4 [Tupaia chinensis]XP_027623779.1 tumor necrosis factor ligand superfamily member 4 [Tupaia chinensis]ELW70911.1 Tumor necrosis factor ligand superfamily member 4 [Tupaia chinensis]